MKINEKNLRYNRVMMIATFSSGAFVAGAISSLIWHPERMEFDLLYFVLIAFLTHSLIFRFVRRDKYAD